MPLNEPVPRDQAGSLTLPAPPRPSRGTAEENAKTEVLECGGNTQLMEARLCQITSSLRALLRSNRELEEALESAPGDADFLQAIAENQLVIRRQGQVAVALVQDMQARGCNVELEEDILSVVIFNGGDGFSEERSAESNTPANPEPADGGIFL